MFDLRYPIGPFQAEVRINPENRRELLLQIAEAPKRLRGAVGDLSADQLDTPYRPEGWTVRQVVHHLADAHLNWYARTKLALTEDKPTLRCCCSTVCTSGGSGYLNRCRQWIGPVSLSIPS